MARVIRPVIAEDAARLCHLQLEAWRSDYQHSVDPEKWLDDDGFDRDAREVNMRRLVTDPSTRAFLVAMQDEEIVGFITVGDARDGDRPGETELSWIYFHPSAQGTGFALELAAAALGDRPAYLWVNERNHRALAFYAKLDFVADGARKDTETLFDEPEVRLVRG